MVCIAWLIGENIKASTLELECSDLGDHLGCVSLLRDEGALGVGEGENGGAKLYDFEGSVLSNISGSGNGDEGGGLVEAEFGAGFGNHLGIFEEDDEFMHNLNVENATYMLDEVDQAVTGSLRANERSTPGETLSGEHTSELILELLVSTEEETDLASSSTDITSCRS